MQNRLAIDLVHVLPAGPRRARKRPLQFVVGYFDASGNFHGKQRQKSKNKMQKLEGDTAKAKGSPPLEYFHSIVRQKRTFVSPHALRYDKSMNTAFKITTLLLLVFTGIAHAAEVPNLGTRKQGTDWPAFLGPTADGKSSETGLNLNWKAKQPKLLWQRPLVESYGMPSISRADSCCMIA